MKYSGVFHLGVHKATLASAGVAAGSRVAVTIERDDQPLATDVVPDDLASALKRSKQAAAAFKAVRPSARREQVKRILEAKKPETRARRVENTIALLLKQSGTTP